ncbi:MAG: energy transducer TonB [Burkholderiales bacterium]
MREGANRALAFAILGSLVAHALILATLPPLRAWHAPQPPPPLIADLLEVPPPAPPVTAPPKAEVPPPPRPRPPKPRPAPIARPEPAPLPEPSPTPPPAPAVAAPAKPVPPVPVVTRIDPRLLEAPPAPPAPPPEMLALGRYRDAVIGAAAQFKRYPRVAIDNNWQGEVRVRMSIGADGRIAELAIARGSGYEVLDRQALEMFRNAKPVVPIPAELRGKPFELELRAVYNLGESG